MTKASFRVETHDTHSTLFVSGDWQLGDTPDAAELCAIIPNTTTTLEISTAELGQWDSSLAIAFLQIINWCKTNKIPLDTQSIPQGLTTTASPCDGCASVSKYQR